MSRLFRNGSFGGSRRHASDPVETQSAITDMARATVHGTVTATGRSKSTPVYRIDELPSPFGDLGSSLSEDGLRETAYEILVGACRSTGGKPLTYISQSERAVDRTPSLQSSLSSTAASKVKKVFGLKKSRSTLSKRRADEDGESTNQGRVKRGLATGELMRVQMRISEQTDSRIRRALLRIAAGQLGRRIESMVLPLELLQQMKATDFPSLEEYEAWKRRILKVLEAGLLLYPHLPLGKTDNAPKRLRQIIEGALGKSFDIEKNYESMQILRTAALSLACRSFDGSSDTCHWADGIPLSLRLYQKLLEACFDINEEGSIIEEADEVLEQIKKTWTILGMNETLHSLCFSWVLFQKYVSSGEVDNDMLFASSNLLVEVEKDVKTLKDPVLSKILTSTLSSTMGWAEKRLLKYRVYFHSDNLESLESIVSLAVLSAKMLAENVTHESGRRSEGDVVQDRVETYIRSSLRSAFNKKLDTAKVTKKSNNKNSPFLHLSVLAQDLRKIAYDEKAMFSPILKRWHPLAAGVAAATLHSCYGKELKQYMFDITELAPDSIQVLRDADKLEKDLVQIAVEESVESEDGGKSIIQQMPPYETDAVVAKLAKSWIKARVDRLKEWVDRLLQKEAWNPRANKERFAQSAVELLRITDEILEDFFRLQIPKHAALLPDLINGLDKCLQQYILKAKSGCGSRSTHVPSLPPLTRCSMGSKYGVFKKKDKAQLAQRRKTLAGNTNGNESSGIQQLCIRINTLHHMRAELEVLQKSAVSHLENVKSTYPDVDGDGAGKWFDLSVASCVEGVRQLSEATAYKVVFHDLNHVLWDGLYVGEVSSSRIELFIQELDQYLEIISSTVHERVRTRVITDVMRATFDGFLLVLLAGGPSRAFCLRDSAILEEDFKCLTDLFWSNGDGLPAEMVDKYSTKVKGILRLFHTDSESLIEQFKQVSLQTYGSSAKSKIPLPPTTGHWNPSEPNTLFRVLCNRHDETAAKFLKKNYNLPTRL